MTPDSLMVHTNISEEPAASIIQRVVNYRDIWGQGLGLRVSQQKLCNWTWDRDLKGLELEKKQGRKVSFLGKWSSEGKKDKIK